MNSLTPRMPFRSLKETLYKVWLAALWSTFFGLFYSVASVVVLTRTNYAYQINELITNGRGPYEIATLLVLFIFLQLNLSKALSLSKRLVTAPNFTIVDKFFGGISLWVPLLLIVQHYYSVSFAVDYQQLAELIALSRIVWLSSLVWLVVRLINFIHIGLSVDKTKDMPILFADNAIGTINTDEDLLGRNSIISQLVSAIRHYQTTGSFVIAITGEWGAGKTTTINFVLQRLKSDKRIIIVNFDPWYFANNGIQSIEALLIRFFEALEEAIKPYVFEPNVSKLFSSYVEAISPIIEKTPINIGAFFKDSNVEKLHQRLSAIIGSVNKKIVVVIDDLDRRYHHSKS